MYLAKTVQLTTQTEHVPLTKQLSHKRRIKPMAIKTKHKKDGYSATTATEYVIPTKPIHSLSTELEPQQLFEDGSQPVRLSPTRQPLFKKGLNLSK